MTVKRYRIVWLQPVGTCSKCGASGGYAWAGEEYCWQHCSEKARARTIMRRGVTAIRQSLGPDYRVQITVLDTRTNTKL